MAAMMTMRIASAELGLGLVLGTTGACGPTVNDEHCLFHRGDDDCGEDERCVVLVGGRRVPGERDGCVSNRAADGLTSELYVHLRNGLPHAWSDDIDPMDADTIHGALARRVIEDGFEACTLDLDVLPEEFVEHVSAIDTVLGARRRLEDLRNKARIRDERVYLDLLEGRATQELNRAVNAWVLACEASQAGSTGGEGPIRERDETDGTSATTAGDSCSTSRDCQDLAAPIRDANMRGVSCEQVQDPDGTCDGLDPWNPVYLDGRCVECTTTNGAA